jgi:tol-pal system protein YbgF
MNSSSFKALRAFAVTAALFAGATASFGQSGNQSSPGFLNGLFGGNDAQPPARERGTQGQGSDLLLRVDRLEAQIRQLTGMVEDLQFRNQQLAEQLRRMQEDAGAQPPGQARVTGSPLPATRPPVVAAVPTPAPATTPATPGRRGDAFDPSQNPNAPGAPRVLGSIPSSGAQPGNQPPEAGAEEPAGARAPGEPLRLSRLNGNGAPDSGSQGVVPGEGPGRTGGPGGAQVATLPPSDSPKDNFDLAYGYVQHKDYALAEDGFRAFLRKYPSDRLAPDAEYWLGETLFQRQRYRDAAEAFLNVSTKYESTAKGPDALLRLGQSLAALGEKEAACASLGEVLRKYPRAALSVKQGVDREQKRAGC